MTPLQETARLYGTPGAEVMWTDPAAVYESEIEPYASPDGRRYEIEEWSVQPPTNHLPDADDITLYMAEWAADRGEMDENGFDQVTVASKHPDVLAAAEALRAAMAAHVTYRMADKHLRSLWVTFDADGDPLLDGEPMYVPNEEIRAEALRRGA